MTPKPDLRPIIESLRGESSCGAGGTIVRRRIDPSSPLDVYVGIEAATGRLGVLLGAHRRLVPSPRDLPAGAGFALRPHAVKDDVKDVVNLGVFCTDTACEDIFLPFMEDLIAHLLAEGSPEKAMQTFLARVALWQRFFVEGGGGGLLSEDAQSGLFAELLVLRDVLIPAAGPAAAVDAWKGPEGKPQDFLLPTCALEVKCSRAKAGGRIAISNEMQLDERPFPHLLLVLVSVSLGGSGHPALADMVESIRTLLRPSGKPFDAFNDKLITAGWLDAHAESYRENRFFLREVQYFEVRADFPRILPASLPTGVVEISYKIDVVAALPFTVDLATVENWLKP